MGVAGCSVGRLCVGLVKRCGSDLGRVFCFRVLWILVFRLASAIGGDGFCGLVFWVCLVQAWVCTWIPGWL